MPASDQGIDPDRYTLIPRTLVFLTRGERVLLLKGAPHKRLWAGLYNGIGGHIERGEDALSAAQRELREETGLDVPDLWLCGTLIVDTGKNTGIGIYIFRGESPRGEPLSSPEGTAEWIGADQINDLPMLEDLPVLLPRILAMQRSAPPFAARSSYNTNGRLQLTFSN